MTQRMLMTEAARDRMIQPMEMTPAVPVRTIPQMPMTEAARDRMILPMGMTPAVPDRMILRTVRIPAAKERILRGMTVATVPPKLPKVPILVTSVPRVPHAVVAA